MSHGADLPALRQCLALMALPAVDRVVPADVLDPVTQLAPFHGQSVLYLDAHCTQVMAQETFSLHVLHAVHEKLRNPLTGAPLQSVCRVRALRPDLSEEDNEELRALWSQELATFGLNSAAKLGLTADTSGPSAVALAGLDVRAPNPMSSELSAGQAAESPPTLVAQAHTAPHGWGGEEPHALVPSDFSASIRSISDMLARMNASMDDALVARQ